MPERFPSEHGYGEPCSSGGSCVTLAVIVRVTVQVARPQGKASLVLRSIVNDALCWPGSGRVPGVLTVLACPPPLCPHVEFAAAAVLGVPAPLEWSGQPARPGMAYAALEWRADAGAAGDWPAGCAALAE